MRCRISLHRCADVVALAVRNHEHPFFARIGNGIVQRFDPLPAVHLIIGRLYLYRRHNVRNRIHQRAVILEYIVRRIGKGIRRKLTRQELLRDIIKFRIEPHANRAFLFYNLLNQPVYHR